MEKLFDKRKFITEKAIEYANLHYKDYYLDYDGFAHDADEFTECLDIDDIELVSRRRERTIFEQGVLFALDMFDELKQDNVC